jgi:GMC oxidoreductase
MAKNKEINIQYFINIQNFIQYFRPKSRGRVLLRSSNPYDKPLFYAGYFTHPDDMKVCKYTRRFFIKEISIFFISNVKEFLVAGSLEQYMTLVCCSVTDLGCLDQSPVRRTKLGFS